MADTPRPRYVLGSDIDLDAEEVRRPDGNRLTEQAAEELAKEAVTIGRRGRPAADPEVGPGDQPAREERRPVADVLRDAVEQYLR
ncbi:MAG: hypothetical protein ACT4NY_17900 [Pseudonocardiales bacterium]